MVCRLGDTGFFRLQGIKILWSLKFLGYLRTLRWKFKKATSKIEVFRAFWNFTLKGPQTPETVGFTIPWILIPNLAKPVGAYVIYENGTLYGQYFLVHPVGFDSQKHLTCSIAIFFVCLKKNISTYHTIFQVASQSQNLC